jgi:hypothetical protein
VDHGTICGAGMDRVANSLMEDVGNQRLLPDDSGDSLKAIDKWLGVEVVVVMATKTWAWSNRSQLASAESCGPTTAVIGSKIFRRIVQPDHGSTNAWICGFGVI